MALLKKLRRAKKIAEVTMLVVVVNGDAYEAGVDDDDADDDGDDGDDNGCNHDDDVGTNHDDANAR